MMSQFMSFQKRNSNAPAAVAPPWTSLVYISFIHSMIFSSQTLTTLCLLNNLIGDNGIRNLSPALKDMKVNSYVFVKSPTIYFKL